MLGTECCCPVLSTHRGTPRTNGYWPCWTRKSHCRILCEMPSFIIPAPPRSGGTAHRRLWSHPLRDEMDPYTPPLARSGIMCYHWQSRRSPEVVEAIRRNGAVYLCAVGGAGTLAARSVVSCEVIAFEDLGCEAVKRLEIRDFPLIVGVDCHGETCLRRRKTADSVHA